MRVLELYCGIGGAATVLGAWGRIVQAIDINLRALEVYRHNLQHPIVARTLESLSVAELASYSADFWWMSPPCQPYTERGNQRDDADPRSQSLLHLIDAIAQIKPPYVAMENVPPFAASRCHARLIDCLTRQGYCIDESVICPSELGYPNLRRRYYLVASQFEIGPRPQRNEPQQPLHAFIDHNLDGEFDVDTSLINQYASAIHTVSAADTHALTACFTSAYGRSVVRSGSYLQIEDRVRRFSPLEVARLLGFPRDFAFPPQLSRDCCWRLIGNSLSLPAVRHALSVIPEFHDYVDADDHLANQP